MKTGFVTAAMYPPGELSETDFTGNGSEKGISVPIYSGKKEKPI